MSRRSLFVCAVAVVLALMPAAAQAAPFAAAASLDATPPVLSIQGVSDGAVYGEAIAPQVASADADLATLQITLDGAAWLSGSPIGAGRHVLFATAIDTSGNVATRSISFTVDTVPPVLIYFAPAPATVDVGASDKEVVYSIELSDDLSGIDMARSGVELRSPNGLRAEVVTPLTLLYGHSDGGSASYTQTLRIPRGSQVGAWTPRGVFYDLAGHVHTVSTSDLLGFGRSKIVVVSSTVQIADTVDAAVLAVTPDTAVAGGSVTITARATDSLGHAIAVYEWYSSVDGVLGTSSSPLFATTGLSAGTHRLSVRARCANGTWSDPSAGDASIVVSAAQSDVTAPSTSSDAKASYVGSATITLTAFDLYGSGVAHTYHELDGGAPVEGTQVTVSAVGAHAITFWSVDRAGNVEPPHAAAFTVTARPVPAVVGTPIAPASVRHGGAFKVHGYVSPAHVSGTYLATLYCYRYQSGRYVLRKTVRARRYAYSSSRSKYAATFSLPNAGRWRIRAYHKDSGHTASYSGYEHVTVR